LSARQEGGDAFAFLAEENGHRFLVPLILRPIEVLKNEGSHFFDITCPYGYPGPLLMINPSGSEKEYFLERATRAFLDGLKQLNAVSAFIRLHPLLTLPVEPLADIGHIVQHGETVFVDLNLSTEEIWSQTNKTTRKHIRRASRKGYIAQMDESWDEFDTFVVIYAEIMERVGASSSLRFSRDYFIELKQALGDHLHLCIVRIGDEIASACLFTEVCGIVQAYLGGTRSEFLEQPSPTKLMYDFVRYWAKERGNHVFHLGGGLGSRRDSIFFFKAGFSRLQSPFYTWRVVVNEEVYSALVKRWESHYGVKADGFQGFFPSYRKPM